ncbi:hypothetical protein AGMMS50255_7430 [Spirochaetia bacterium]|nr:hypothetical protein AGMMS50255_7430 [Spirochaetia bacterium]
MSHRILLTLAVLLPLIPLSAQDFGFDFDDEAAGGGDSGVLAVSIGGEVSASMTGFIDDFSDGLDYLGEAYVRAYFGIVDIEGGLRRITWGKADEVVSLLPGGGLFKIPSRRALLTDQAVKRNGLCPERLSGHKEHQDYGAAPVHLYIFRKIFTSTSTLVRSLSSSPTISTVSF